jgi:hypothetical protein
LLEEYQSGNAPFQWLVEIAGEDWDEKHEQELWAPEFGTLTVWQDECEPYCCLVLNGALKGRIFCFIDYLCPPLLEPSATFLDW